VFVDDFREIMAQDDESLFDEANMLYLRVVVYWKQSLSNMFGPCICCNFVISGLQSESLSNISKID
jgi:hypothetical protein